MADNNQNLIEQLTSDPDFLSLPPTEQDTIFEELSQQRRRFSPFQETMQLAEYSPILKSVPWLIGAQGTTGTLGTFVRGAKTLFSRPAREALAKRVLTAPATRRRAANRLFGRQLSKIEGTVDLSEDVSKLRATVGQTKQGTRLLESAKRALPDDLQNALTTPELATSLTAQQATVLRTAINNVPGIARELGRTNPAYLNIERPFVEFAKMTGKKMARLPGKRELDIAHAAKMRDIERVQPFLKKESQLAYGGTPIFRRGVGRLSPDLRATGAAGRIFGKRLSQDIRDVRNVKRLGAAGAGVAARPFLTPIVRTAIQSSE